MDGRFVPETVRQGKARRSVSVSIEQDGVAVSACHPNPRGVGAGWGDAVRTWSQCVGGAVSPGVRQGRGGRAASFGGGRGDHPAGDRGSDRVGAGSAGQSASSGGGGRASRVVGGIPASGA